MAYKFQVGRTRLSGSTLFENGLDVSGSAAVETALVVPAIGVSTDKDIISLAAQTVDFANDVDVDIKKAGGLQLAGTQVTADAGELNLLDGASAGTVVNSKAVIYSAGGLVQGTDFKGPDGFDIGNASVADFMKFNAAEIVIKDGALDFDIASHDSSNGLKLGGTLVSATAAELNKLDGATADVTAAKLSKLSTLTDDEVDFLDGATAGSGLASKVLVLDSDKRIASVDRYTGNDFRFSQEIKSSSKISISGSGVISGSAALKAGGDLTVGGSSVIFSAISADTALDVANDGLYFRDAGDSTMKRVAVSSFVTDIAGDALKNDANQLQLDIDGLSAETIATGDTIVFNDDTDDGLHKVTFDNLITKSPALLTEEAINTSDDFIMFLDGSGTGDAKKEKLVDLMELQAGTGVTVSGGQFTVDTSGGDRISVAAIANGGTAAAGLNAFADITANASVSLPASPTAGDIVIIKAANVQPGVTITVNRQGSHVIDGQASQVLESPFAALTCVYASGSTGNDWRII